MFDDIPYTELKKEPERPYFVSDGEYDAYCTVQVDYKTLTFKVVFSLRKSGDILWGTFPLNLDAVQEVIKESKIAPTFLRTPLTEKAACAATRMVMATLAQWARQRRLYELVDHSQNKA